MRCWEFTLKLSLPTQLCEHPPIIYKTPHKTKNCTISNVMWIITRFTMTTTQINDEDPICYCDTNFMM